MRLRWVVSERVRTLVGCNHTVRVQVLHRTPQEFSDKFAYLLARVAR